MFSLNYQGKNYDRWSLRQSKSPKDYEKLALSNAIDKPAFANFKGRGMAQVLLGKKFRKV